eukprot:7377249-Prymnesium_polylepis.1
MDDPVATLLVLALAPLVFLLASRRRSPPQPPTPAKAPRNRTPHVARLDASDAVPLRVDELDSAMVSVREHVRNERILEAGALFARVRRTQRETGATVDTSVLPELSTQALEYRYMLCLDALRELNTADGWRELTPPGAQDSARCFVQHGDGTLWAKTEAEMPIAAHAVVSVLRETHLFREWYPRCAESMSLHASGRMERVFRLVQALRVPLLGALRWDILLEAFGIDALDDGFFLACGRSAEQEDWPHCAFPPPPDGGNRLSIHALQLLVEPLAAGRTRAVLQVKVAHGPLPNFVLEYIITHLTNKIFGRLVAAAARMTEQPQGSPHAEAVAADLDFYERWLRPRVDRRLAILEQQQPTP